MVIEKPVGEDFTDAKTAHKELQHYCIVIPLKYEIKYMNWFAHTPTTVIIHTEKVSAILPHSELIRKKTVHYFRLIPRLKINGSDKKNFSKHLFCFLYNHPNRRGVHIMQKWQEFQKAPFKVKMANQMTKLSKVDI